MQLHLEFVLDLLHVNSAQSLLDFNQSSQFVRLFFCSSSAAPHKRVQHPMVSEITLHAQPARYCKSFYLDCNWTITLQTPHNTSTWRECGVKVELLNKVFWVLSARLLDLADLNLLVRQLQNSAKKCKAINNFHYLVFFILFYFIKIILYDTWCEV